MVIGQEGTRGSFAEVLLISDVSSEESKSFSSFAVSALLHLYPNTQLPISFPQNLFVSRRSPSISPLNLVAFLQGNASPGERVIFTWYYPFGSSSTTNLKHSLIPLRSNDLCDKKLQRQKASTVETNASLMAFDKNARNVVLRRKTVIFVYTFDARAVFFLSRQPWAVAKSFAASNNVWDQRSTGLTKQRIRWMQRVLG